MEKFYHSATVIRYGDGDEEGEEIEIEVEIGVHSWGCPAQTYGPPENCYPAEGPEIEILSAWIYDKENKNPPKVFLTKEESEKIELEFLENPPESDYPDYD